MKALGVAGLARVVVLPFGFERDGVVVRQISVQPATTAANLVAASYMTSPAPEGVDATFWRGACQIAARCAPRLTPTELLALHEDDGDAIADAKREVDAATETFRHHGDASHPGNGGAGGTAALEPGGVPAAPAGPGGAAAGGARRPTKRSQRIG